MTKLNIWISGLSPFVIYCMKYQFKMDSYDHKLPRKMNYRKDDSQDYAYEKYYRYLN